MKCDITANCKGTLQPEPEQDESIKLYLVCDACLEVKIVPRSKDELIELYLNRVQKLIDGWKLQDIYNEEAKAVLQSFASEKDDKDLKNLPLAHVFVKNHNALKPRKDL